MNETRLVSFDGGVSAAVALRRLAAGSPPDAGVGDAPRIARGGGYSYAAASFGPGSVVLDASGLRGVRRFDVETGRIEVAAGTTLGDLLALGAPRGWWLPVQPGYPDITIGGCIAAHVHGKNPAREGTFARSVLSLELFHPDHGTLEVDRERRPELFELTCGGFGLTGVILSARLQLERLPGPRFSLRRVPIAGLREGLERVDAAAPGCAYAYTWHDGTARGGRFGRGFAYLAELPAGPPPTGRVVPRYRRLTAGGRARLPLSVWNAATAPLLVAGFRLGEALRRRRSDVALFDALFPFARRAVYFEAFGRRGLAECQVLLPRDSAAGFLDELEREIPARDAPVLMLSIKPFAGSGRFLRFEGDGICVTLDLIRSPVGLDFLGVLDRMTIAARGIPNLLKDSRLPRDVVRACYPEYGLFRERLRAYDPARRFGSELSARLDL